MSLTDNATRLCDEHMTEQDGRYVKVPALLDQLENAGRETRIGAQAGSGEKGLLYSADVADLERCMLEEARQYMQDLCPSFRGDLKDIIRFWVREDITGTDMISFENVTEGWIEEIEKLIHPPKPVPRRRIPGGCPACGVVYHEGKAAMIIHCRDEDEEFLPFAQWTALCAACGSGWVNYEQMTWLIHVAHAGNDTPRTENPNRGIQAM